jgi:hypothetical protein
MSRNPSKRRKRGRRGDLLPLYDIDTMSKRQLQIFAKEPTIDPTPQQRHRMESWLHMYFPNQDKDMHEKALRMLLRARKIYPTRPNGFYVAVVTLQEMAKIRLEPQPDIPRYEWLYSTLPKYAQFRRFFNVTAAMRKSREKPLTPTDNKHTIAQGDQ